MWDSRGRPTVEAEVATAGGAVGRAIAPAGASRGRGEAVDLRDGGPALAGYDVRRAVANVTERIGPALLGLDVDDQAAVDARLLGLDPDPALGRLGGNAAVATSMAVAWAAAASHGRPLWEQLRAQDTSWRAADSDRAVPPPTPLRIPLPEIQIFGGGAHAARRLDLQDLMVVCPGAADFAQAMEWTAEVHLAAGRALAERGELAGVADEGGWWPAFARNEDALVALTRAIEVAGARTGFGAGVDVGIALDVAASELLVDGHYRLALDGAELGGDAMVEQVVDWCRRFPVRSVEDPLAEDDHAGLAAATRQLGALGVQVVGDDALVTNAGRVRRAAAEGWVDTLLLKPNQAGTLSGARDAWDEARRAGFGGIASARSGESEDVTIVHVAIGWGLPQLKVGSITRGERTAKWNEVLRIEEATGAPLARPFTD